MPAPSQLALLAHCSVKSLAPGFFRRQSGYVRSLQVGLSNGIAPRRSLPIR
jgi:hypothetical protein